jgi:tungstate transport system ATP-binding protein
MVVRILPLTLDAVEVRRAGRVILGPVTWTLDGPGITVVLGPNGSGKTTLLRVMHGLDRVRQGRVSWAGQDTRARQAFVFQTPILMRRSVLDCIAFPLLLDGQSRKDARRAAAAQAEKVGLGDRLQLEAFDLSGGEKQKLAIARALIRAPQVLFLDEPCANLDGASIREIEAILTAARDTGTRIVLSTHHIGQARRLADEIVFLYNGKLHETGTAPAFFAAPQTPEATAHINGDLLP